MSLWQLIPAGIFLIVTLIVFAVLYALEQRSAQSRMLRERLAAVDKAQKRHPSEELALLRDELMSGIPALNKLLAHSQRMSDVQTWVAQAGMSVRPGKLLLLCASLGGFAGLGVLAFSHSRLFAVLAGALGTALPVLYVSIRRSRRFKRFEELFPEAMDILARAIRAGHASTTALELVADEMAEPVASEFRKLYEEQKFGLPFRDALLNFSERMPLVDVKIFVTAVMLQRETGGNLAEILDKLSYIVRERFKILRQVRVYTAQGRLTLMILMALPPGCVALMMFVNAGFIRPLFTDPLGHMLLAAGVTMQTLGYFLIRKIIAIKV